MKQGVIILLVWVGWFALAARAQADDADAFGGANIGERLFLETRFAQFFFTNSAGDANAVLTNSDPVMDNTVTIYGPQPGPFAGQSMNCRACHLVEEHEGIGNRTYCDFARRSPVPEIGDGRVTTPRNALTLVDALLPRQVPLFLHHDGQFAAVDDLVVGTLTGRNYGWQPTEYEAAIHHIAHIIRDDDGSGFLAGQYGGSSYAEAFAGLAGIESQYLIPSKNRMNVLVTDTNSPNYVTDEQIVQNIAELMKDYMLTLVFSQDVAGNFDGSPYDAFLIKNGLPQQPDPGETQLQYGRRLLQLLAGLTNPQWVTDPDAGFFVTNAQGQQFQFGTNELAGLEIFLTDQSNLTVATNLQLQGVTTRIAVGNCITCHAPPTFTDSLFHNNGAAQAEYDQIHGAGAFMALAVPSWAERATNYDAYLPPTANHPNALGIFETPPTTNHPAQVDLGLWNVYANPDFPAPQAGLQSVLPQLLSVASPQIGRVTVVGTNLVLSATNVSTDWTYYLITSTNLLSPLANWTVVATNNFAGSGQLYFTNVLTANAPQQFYGLLLGNISPAAALPGTLALFKTPTVRDLVSSEPYLHTGQLDTIEDVLQFYINASAQARAGGIRNGDPQLSGIYLDASAVAPLAAFLRALNESEYVDAPCPCDPQPVPPPQ